MGQGQDQGVGQMLQQGVAVAADEGEEDGADTAEANQQSNDKNVSDQPERAFKGGVHHHDVEHTYNNNKQICQPHDGRLLEAVLESLEERLDHLVLAIVEHIVHHLVSGAECGTHGDHWDAAKKCQNIQPDELGDPGHDAKQTGIGIKKTIHVVVSPYLTMTTVYSLLTKVARGKRV